MPFGNRINNFAAVLSFSFIIASVVVSIIGMRISNKQVVEQTQSNQSTIIKQNQGLAEDHREMLNILHRIESRYLDGQPK